MRNIDFKYTCTNHSHLSSNIFVIYIIICEDYLISNYDLIRVLDERKVLVNKYQKTIYYHITLINQECSY